MVNEDFPIVLETLEIGQNPSFDNFFRNSFIHYYLRIPELQDFSDEDRLTVAKHRRDTIENISKFCVGFDKVDKNVFYSFIAYTYSENQLFVHFAYVKKKFRGFGFFKESLQILKESANEYYYSLPIKLKKKNYMPEFQKRVI